MIATHPAPSLAAVLRERAWGAGGGPCRASGGVLMCVMQEMCKVPHVEMVCRGTPWDRLWLGPC